MQTTGHNHPQQKQERDAPSDTLKKRKRKINRLRYQGVNQQKPFRRSNYLLKVPYKPNRTMKNLQVRAHRRGRKEWGTILWQKREKNGKNGRMAKKKKEKKNTMIEVNFEKKVCKKERDRRTATTTRKSRRRHKREVKRQNNPTKRDRHCFERERRGCIRGRVSRRIRDS